MASIFLSYARGDRLFAERVASALQTAGYDVWWDRRLDGGEEFSAEIEAELDAADVVIVAWSAQSVKSRWVRDEASVGAERGRLVPLSVDGILPPMGFRQFHTLDLRGWKGGPRDRRTIELLHSIESKRANKQVGLSPPLPRPRYPFAGSPNRLWPLLILIVVVALATATTLLVMRHSAQVASERRKPTMALVPFTTASSDPRLRELASEIGDSLTHSFSQSGLPLQLPGVPPRGGATGADFVISGDLSKAGNKVVAAVRLDDVAHHVTVFSHTFEASDDDVANLADRIGAQMAGNLTWAAPLMVLRSHRLDPALMANLLATYDFSGADPLTAYQNARRVAAEAPNVAIAQISVAFDTSFVLDELPRAERVQAVEQARAAADRAMRLGPDFGDTYGSWCLLHSDALLAECERRLRAGRRTDPDAPFLNSFLSGLLRGVGRFDEASDLSRLSYSHDPYVPTKIGWMLISAEYEGDRDRARALYQQGVRWWPDFRATFSEDRLRGMLERGDFDSIPALETEVGPEAWSRSYANSGALALDWHSPSAVRKFCSSAGQLDVQARCILVLARFGDFDDAYAVAARTYPRRLGRTAAETENIWLNDPYGDGWTEFVTSPGAAPLRNDPRYLALAQRTGLLAYWRGGTPPDFCRKNPEKICPALLKAH